MSERNLADHMKLSGTPENIVFQREFKVIRELNRNHHGCDKPPFRSGIVRHSLGYVPVPKFKTPVKKKSVQRTQSSSSRSATIIMDSPQQSSETNFPQSHQSVEDMTLNLDHVQVIDESNTILRIDLLEKVFRDLNVISGKSERTLFATQCRKDLSVVLSQLDQTCKKWNDVFKNETNIPDHVISQINVINGMLGLLAGGKMLQYRKLIDKYEEGMENPPILEDDLRGFWDLIFIEVKNVRTIFHKLQQLQYNNWNIENALTSSNMKRDKKISNVPTPKYKAQSKIRLAIQEARARWNKNRMTQSENHDHVSQELCVNLSASELTESQHVSGDTNNTNDRIQLDSNIHEVSHSTTTQSEESLPVSGDTNNENDGVQSDPNIDEVFHSTPMVLEGERTLRRSQRIKDRLASRLLKESLPVSGNENDGVQSDSNIHVVSHSTPMVLEGERTLRRSERIKNRLACKFLNDDSSVLPCTRDQTTPLRHISKRHLEFGSSVKKVTFTTDKNEVGDITGNGTPADNNRAFSPIQCSAEQSTPQAGCSKNSTPFRHSPQSTGKTSCTLLECSSPEE